MVRFLVVMILALGLCAGAAYVFKLPPFGPDTPQAQGGQPGAQDDKPAKAPELGGLLYAPIKLPPAPPLGDDLKPGPNPRHLGRQIVLPDCHLVPFDKQDVSSSKDGLLIIIGTPVDQEPAMKTPDLPTAEIPVGGKKLYWPYLRLKEGDIVQHGQIVAVVDPTKPLNDRLYKKAKIVAAQADQTASAYTAKEAQARLERLNRLLMGEAGRKDALVSAEDYGAAVLTRDKYVQEEVSKREAVNLAVIEFQQADADLELYRIRSAIPGKSYIKAIYKNMGEGVKDLGKDVAAIMHLYSLSKLQVEGTVEAQYFDQLEELRKANKDGIRIVIEPSQDLAGKTLPKVHRAEITGVAASYDPKRPDEPRFVTASEDKTVVVWRHKQPAPEDVLQHDSHVRVVACAPKGSPRSWCVTGCADGSLYIWDLDNPKVPIHKLKEKHADGVSALAFSPDGKWFASGGQDNSIILWETATGTEKYPFDFEHGVAEPHQGTVTMLAFTPDSKLVSAARDNTLRVWTLHEKGASLDGEPIYGRGGSVTAPGVTTDGKLMVFDQGRTLQLLSVANHRTMSVLQTPLAGSPFETVAQFSPDGNLMLTAGAAEGRMQLWRTPQPGVRGYEVRQLVSDERSPVTCAAFAPDGSFAITGTKDGYVHFWQLPTAKAIREHRLQVDQDGKLLTLSHFDRALDASKIRVGVNLQNPESPEYPDGRLIPGRRVTLVIDP